MWMIFKERLSQFETADILDRNGNLLYEIVDLMREGGVM
jgi:hypothetical protein